MGPANETPGHPFRSSDAEELWEGRARQLASASLFPRCRLADDVIERPWGWVFRQVGDIGVGPSNMIVVLRDGTVEVPPSIVTIDDYDRRFGLLPPLRPPPLRQRFVEYAPLVINGLWIGLLLLFFAACILGSCMKR